MKGDLITNMASNIIAHAAEAIIIKQEDKVVKRRIKKGYRIPELDEKLRKLRTRSEGKLLEKASKLITVPKLIKIDEKTKEIIMQFIEGKKLSENLDNLPNKLEIAEKIGQETAKLHDSDIIHGDLTTSNMILIENKNAEKVEQDKETGRTSIESKEKILLTINKENFKVYFIDFGLGFISKKIEDKAVDIHLFKQALEAKHFNFYEQLFEAFLKGYKASKNHAAVMSQLKKVEIRGRYKH